MRNWSDEEMVRLITSAKESAEKMKAENNPGTSSPFMDGLIHGYSFALELLQERSAAKAEGKAS